MQIPRLDIDMDNQALQKIRDTFASSQQIVLLVGKNPSVDQMAAALSLYLALGAKGKKTNVISPTEPIVELSSLVGIDKVTMGMAGSSGDLVVSFPYREGEIEKVSYTIEGDSLNIVVKAGEAGLTFSEQDVIFKRGSEKPDLIVTIGVPHLSGITDLISEDLTRDVPVINIDHSNLNEGYGSMVLVSPKFSSLSEQIADLLLNLEYEIDVDMAQNLMLGLTAGTNNFQNASTSYLAFEIAGILMKRGAQRLPIRGAQQSQNMAQSTAAPVLAREQRSQGAQVAQGAQSPQSGQSGQRPQQQSQSQSQQAPQQREDRQDRRDAIRDALRSQSQVRNDQRSFAPRTDRQQGQPSQVQPQRVQSQQIQPQQVQPQQVREQQSEPKPPSDWLTPKVYKGSSSV